MDNFAIKLNNIYKKFDDIDGGTMPALKDIELTIHHGEFFVMLGPSGCGKSTLLRIMSGLEKQSGGEVIFGSGLTPKDLSFVFQQFALLPWLNVAENIRLGLTSRPMPEKEKDAIVHRELEQLGLTHFANARIHELSGGMRQRVGLARALAVDPKIILLDEPFSELDSFIAEELRTELLRIWTERKMTIVMVTHLIDEALELADRIAVLTPRPGHIEKIVHNPLPRPRAKRTPEFFRYYDELYRIIKP